jgi:hypothetical protein
VAHRVISLLRGKSASFGATGHRDRLVHAPNLCFGLGKSIVLSVPKYLKRCS